MKQSGSTTQVCSFHDISFPILENKNVHPPESGKLFASWYLRVNLTFPMSSKLEQRFDKTRQGRDEVTCRTFVGLSIQQIIERCLLMASPVLRHNTGQGM